MLTKKYFEDLLDDVEVVIEGCGVVGGRRFRRTCWFHRESITVEQILGWADEHHRLTGRWPGVDSKPVGLPPGLTWLSVRTALDKGLRGLPGGSSLVKVLVEHRGYEASRPRLTVESILAWADVHHAATGKWPSERTVAVAGNPGESWTAISQALAVGTRGLPGGSSLARLLAERRGTRNQSALPRLSLEQIRSWAEVYRAAQGRWPSAKSGPIPESSDSAESWSGVNAALRHGCRGLPGGSTLAQLLGAT
jgi:hypothetical protein